MKRILCSFLFVFLLTSQIYAESITGKLIVEDNAYRILKMDGSKLNLEIDHKFNSSLPTLTDEFLSNLKYAPSNQLYPQYFLQFDGKRIGRKFHATNVPRIRSGSKRLSGVLKSENNQYTINGENVVFDKAIVVNGSSFDQKSINSFIGKSVEATVRAGGIITAIVPSEIYSATPISSPTISNFDQSFFQSVYRDATSRSDKSFRKRIFNKSGKVIRPGDKALMISLSGRQNDDTGSIGGHFAVGEATVMNDGRLDIEMWNYYDLPNEKMIIPGKNDFIDYFGNLTAGQNNYRPTFGLILYGFSQNKLDKLKEIVEKDFVHMRERDKDFGVYYNCTTVSVDGLKKVGARPNRANNPFKQVGFDIAGSLTTTLGLIYPGIPKLFGHKEAAWDMKKSIDYLLLHDPTNFLPRAAFNGYLENLEKIVKKFNIKTVDYIFHAQTRSNRPVGGAPARKMMLVKNGKDMYDQTVDPQAPWSLEEIDQKIQEMMETDIKK